MKTAGIKITLLLITVILLSAGIIARNKNVNIKPFACEGVWKGNLGMLMNAPDDYFEIVLQKGGALKRVNKKGIITGTGQWNIQENRFNGSYTFLDGSGAVKMNGVVNQLSKTISGTWNNEGNNSGTWKVIQSKF